MEGCHIFKKILKDSAHLPTVMLIIGYPVYWFELFAFKHPTGQTSVLATLLFLLAACVILVREFNGSDRKIGSLKKQLMMQDLSTRWIITSGVFLAFLILFYAFYASLLPAHLIQESDAMNYHITLPRQHLILGSFSHIPWAADDLFLLPIQFALTPYWLATDLPNKWPQFLFLIGLCLVAKNLAGYFGKEKWLGKIVVVLAILGSHHVGIQMGTAMIDLVICYLCFAALDSFLKGNMVLCLIEFSFFFWSKAFFPLQITAAAGILIIAWVILKRCKFHSISLGFTGVDEAAKKKYVSQIKKMWGGFIIVSLLVAGPFLAKSLFYSGTPLFPFMTGSVMLNKNIDQNSINWKSIEAAAEVFTEEIRNNYGYGRSITAFIKHFWLIAVPDKGVNNQFDYPLGLIYLLAIGPFLVQWIASLKLRTFSILSNFIVLYWISWWFGSQQSRFLYIPVLLMVILVVAQVLKPSRLFMIAVILGLCFNLLSVFRAHRNDIGKQPMEVLREKDKKLVTMSKDYHRAGRKDMVELDFHDVAFAQFPVKVIKENLPHTLAL